MANSSIGETLKSLNDKYQQKDYDAVVKLLLDNKSKFDDGIFHYNLGTAYLKKGNLPAARFHFEKSLSNGYIGPHLYKNLSTVKSQLSAGTFERSQSIKDQIFLYSFNIPIHYFYTFSLTVILFALIGKQFYRFKKSAVALLFIVALIPLSFGVYLKQNYQQAILLDDTAIYEGPSRSFDKSTEIPGGIKVIVEKENDSWLLIKSPIFYTGWVQRKDLGIF